MLTRPDAGLLVVLLFAARPGQPAAPPLASGAPFQLALPWFAYATWRYGSPLPNSVLAKINQNQLMEVSGSVSFIAQLVRHQTGGSPVLAAALVVALAAGLYVIVRHARALWWLPAWAILYTGSYTALNVASTFPWYFVPPLAGLALICALGLGHWLGDRPMVPNVRSGAGILSGARRNRILPGCDARSRRTPAPPTSSFDYGPAGLRSGCLQVAFGIDSNSRATLLRAATGLACTAIILFTYGRSALADSLNDRPGYPPEYREAGTWLAANTDPTARVAAIEIGVIGQLSGRPILDTMGLVSPELRGHLVGWEETLTYALWQYEPAYLVALTGTGWDTLTPQWWFREQYREVAAFGRVAIYERQSAPPPAGYVVEERAEFAEGFAVTGFETARQILRRASRRACCCM